MLPRAPPPPPPLPLAFKSISGAKMFESLICDAMASLVAPAPAAAAAGVVAAADADDGNDVELLILPAPSVSWLLSDICLFFYFFAFALVDVVSRSWSSLFSFKKTNLSTAYLVMHSEEVEVEVKKRSKDWKRNRISWKRQRKNPEKETSRKNDWGNGKGTKS